MDYSKYHRDKTYTDFENHFRNIFRKRVNIIENYKSAPSSPLKIVNSRQRRVLDIGASTGTMLDIFKEKGFETWGVEPSVVAAQSAKRRGHRILVNYFEKTKLPQNYFDEVIMNHTLEHLDNPLVVLKKIHKILIKNGILLIDVPNAGGLGSKILGDRWPYKLPNEHRYQFTKDSLSKIFISSGFEVIHFESRSGIFEFANPLQEIWESLITLKKRFFTNLINIPYDVLVTSINMGDSMTMVGKKNED